MNKLFINSLLMLTVLMFSCGSPENKIDPNEKNKIDSAAAAPKAANDTTPPSDGVFERKHANGQVSIRGEMRNGKREGTWFSYYDNGQLQSQAEYVKGVRNGKSITWYTNGKKRFEGTYTNDKQSGTWQYWEENGKLSKEMNYDQPAAQ